MYRELVFESAEHVFARKGFEAATMQEVAAEAGISLKTLYATFPGKAELYAEIGRTRGIEFAEVVTAAQQSGGDALERLTAGVYAYVDFLVRHPDFLSIHLREGRTWGLEPDEIGVRESWARGVAGMAEILRDGQEEGIFYPGDAELMAMTGIAVMQVQLARYAGGIGEEDAARLADETLLQLRRLLCRPEHVDRGRAAA
jgi:AcrR family transcriptional regulator